MPRHRLARWPTALPAGLLAAAAVGLSGCLADIRSPAQAAAAEAGAPALAGPRWLLQRGAHALRTEGLVRADGSAFEQAALRGQWTVVFVGFTTCSQTCPVTLSLMSHWAQQAPALQFMFSSIDPLNDSPERLRTYMAAFDARIAAVTGQPAAANAWASALGAGHAPGEDGIDHSNSLFVIGPDAKLAGLLLRPADPAELAADLRSLQAAWQAATPAMGPLASR